VAPCVLGPRPAFRPRPPENSNLPTIAPPKIAWKMLERHRNPLGPRLVFPPGGPEAPLGPPPTRRAKLCPGLTTNRFREPWPANAGSPAKALLPR